MHSTTNKKYNKINNTYNYNTTSNNKQTNKLIIVKIIIK